MFSCTSLELTGYSVFLFTNPTLTEDTWGQIDKAFCTVVHIHSARRDAHVIYETGASAWKSRLLAI